ncbi:MAG: tripartite tricarboxylate transporter TctB family protein [Bacillota bacterium]|nr:tripartite tricarboxylate transporter TctB family protein [Bacillota bacterium]
MKEVGFLCGVLAVLGVYAASAMQLDFGSASQPGTGFFPVLLCAAGAILALVCLVPAARDAVRESRRRPRTEGAGPGPGRSRMTLKLDSPPVRVTAFCVLSAVYILLLDRLGYVVSTALLAIGLLRMMAVRWMLAVVVGVASSVALWALLGRWLNVLLPRGVLGF